MWKSLGITWPQQNKCSESLDLHFFMPNTMQKQFNCVGGQLLRLIVRNVVFKRSWIQYNQMRCRQMTHDDGMGDFWRPDPTKLEVSMECFVILPYNRFNHIAELQFHADDFVQFIFFDDSQHKVLFGLADLMDVGTRNLWECKESFFVHPTMQWVIQKGYIHHLKIAWHC